MSTVDEHEVFRELLEEDIYAVEKEFNRPMHHKKGIRRYALIVQFIDGNSAVIRSDGVTMTWLAKCLANSADIADIAEILQNVKK